MKRVLLAATLATTTLFGAATPQTAHAHCQVPCGIYGDELKFEELRQHVDTVKKAAAQIQELAGKTDAQSAQQLARWVANKESHATAIQEAMQSYFLAQRVKLPADDASEADKNAYLTKLHQIHAVIVHAMKAKQSADPQTADGLKAALDTFHTNYHGH